MAWQPEVIACLVLLVTVAVVLPCCCALCWRCNPEWKWCPCLGWRRVEVVDFAGES